MTDHTKFNKIINFNHRGLYSQIETNLKDFMDWSFLNIYAYNNVNIVSGINPQSYTLHSVSTSGVSSTSSNIWEGAFKDWVWESVPNISINNISGVSLNGTSLPAPTGSGNYSYHINYPLGRIVFKNPVSSSSIVKLEYAYRQIQMYKSEDAPWWKEIQKNNYGSFNNNNFTNQLLSEHKLQIPFIMIENIARNNQIPYEIGNSDNILDQDILFHIFTNNPSQRSNLIDILLSQKDKGLILYDLNKVVLDGVYGLNYRGEKNINGLNYGQLVNNPNYFYRNCYVKNSILSELNNFSTTLYNGIVRWTLEIFP
jgi:hypothetical protein